jgi:hypothetical protein
MAYERTLKMLSNGLENTASDCETLFRLLDARAHLRRSANLFAPVQPQLPRPAYRTKTESAAAAVAYARAILEDYASILRYFRLRPSDANPVDPQSYGEGGLLYLVTDWQSLRAGILKAIVTEYGGRAAGLPLAPHPGPASEDRLWAEVAAWLEKLVLDTHSFLIAQGLTPGRVLPPLAPTPSIIESLVELELIFHRATLDAMQIVGALPYHLYHAAHP